MSTLADKLASGFARLTPFARQTDAPLANVKAAARWIDSLAVGDAFKSQRAIHQALKHFNEDRTAFTKDRLAVLMLLDEKSRDLQDTLAQQYLRNPRMARPAENQLWHAIYGLHREVADGYRRFVRALRREGNNKPADGSQIPLLTLRAIRAHGLLLKWRAIRYLPAGDKLWLALHTLYRIAETDGFQGQRQLAYADDPADCSCETAYLHIMMLNLANSGSLYPRQLDLLDRWLRSWHGMLRLESRLDAARHNFVVNLSADHGPRRVRRPDNDKPMRFWATTDLLRTLEQLHSALRAGSTPAQLGLSDGARATESQELLEHMQRQWSSLASREQRRAPREATKRLVDVVHGLGALVGQIKAGDAPAPTSPYTGLDYEAEDDMRMYGFVTERTRERALHRQVPHSHASPDVERWVMQDESEFGYGAIVEIRDKDWLRVGALVGVKAHDAATWRLGIVRRLSRLSDDSSSVGIETLAEPPALTTLSHAGTPGYTVNGFDNSGASLPRSGLWLAGHDGRDSVIIDPIHFAPDKVFEVRDAAQGPRLVSLRDPIERSEGWMRVAVEPAAG